MPDEQGEQSQIKREGKTIYEAGYGAIFARNFVAGFSRALGSIFVYLILGGLLYALVTTYIIPQVQRILPESFPFFGPSLLQQLQTQPLSEESLQNNPTFTVSPEQVNNALDIIEQAQHEQQKTPTPTPSE